MKQVNVKSIDKSKIKDSIKKCPKEVQDYIKALEKSIELNNIIMGDATKKIKELHQKLNSDRVVVELSDNEIKIITKKELDEWKKSAMEFDGFEGWIVKGVLI